jgi:hypothetical protein
LSDLISKESNVDANAKGLHNRGGDVHDKTDPLSQLIHLDHKPTATTPPPPSSDFLFLPRLSAGAAR